MCAQCEQSVCYYVSKTVLLVPVIPGSKEYLKDTYIFLVSCNINNQINVQETQKVGGLH